MTNNNNYYKGKATLIDRFEHALRGLWCAWQKEPNFKLEIGVAIMVLSAIIILPLSRGETAILVLIIAFVLALEIINSVFERLLDFIHPGFSPQVKHIKDTMAAVVLLGASTSIIIGGLILTPAFLKFDPVFYKWVLNIQTDWLVRISELITFLGSWKAILGLVIVIAPWLLYRKRYEILSLLLGSVIFGEILVFTLKIFFERERPPLTEFKVDEFSFPSGHAFIGTAFWLSVGYIFTSYSTKRKHLWVIIGAIICLIAFSRLFLSVHWLSDIVGGVLLGGTWFFLWFGINKRIFQKK